MTAAVIRDGEKVLLAQRKPGDPLAGKWEFPGGKIETGETTEECLMRELFEELGITVRIGRIIAVSPWDYPHVSIELIAFKAEILSGVPTPTDHAAVAWVRQEEVSSWDLAPADVPIAEALLRIGD